MAAPPNEFWHEDELKDLILFAQSLREENEELRSKIIVMDQMVKNREATLKRANIYIKQLEQQIIRIQTQLN